MRYSTARSGLLKLARMARRTCSLGKPISIMPLIALWRWAPERNELGSPKAAGAGDGASAGGGVVSAGAAGAGAGAAGGGGAAAGAGGSTAGAGAEDDAAGVGFGWRARVRGWAIWTSAGRRTLDTMRTRKSFSLNPHDSTGLSSVRILPGAVCEGYEGAECGTWADRNRLFSARRRDGPATAGFWP